MASEVIPRSAPSWSRPCGTGPGERVLDVAAGSGNASIPAAETGAEVVATDLHPRAARGRPGRAWVTGADHLAGGATPRRCPSRTASFDVVMSCVGVMFAPHHQVAADELLRVCRPGGRIGLLSWTPEGFIGQMFATMKPYAPPPPPGAQPPPLWGSEDHVRELLGDRVERRRGDRRRRCTSTASPPPADFREYFKARYGPTIAVYRANAEDPERCAALDRDLDALGRALRRRRRHDGVGVPAGHGPAS